MASMKAEEWMESARVSVDIKFYGEVNPPEWWGSDRDNVRRWNVVLTGPEGAYAFPYYGGMGINDISAAEVLETLAMDARGVYEDGADGVAAAVVFEEWARGYGYNDDSRQAERTYNAVKDWSRAVYDILRCEKDWEEFLTIEES